VHVILAQPWYNRDGGRVDGKYTGQHAMIGQSNTGLRSLERTRLPFRNCKQSETNLVVGAGAPDADYLVRILRTPGSEFDWL
jgi:hypothetical protein